MTKKNYTSLKKVVNDISVKSGNAKDLDPDDLLYLANGIAELIIPGESFVASLALIDINNYKGTLPSGFKYVSQALYKIDNGVELQPSSIIEYTQKLYGTDCNIDVSLRCDPCVNNCNTKNIVMDVDYNYLVSHPEWAYNHSQFFYGNRTSEHYISGQNVYPEFKLMRRTTDNFFNIPYHINDCINLNADSTIEYNIEYPNIVVNFKKGTVLLAYIGVPLDEEGYRLIPDVEEVYEAIFYSIRERLAEQTFDIEPNQNNRIALQMAEQKAIQKRKRATAYLSSLEPDEWEMFIRNHWMRTIPNYTWEAMGNKYVSDRNYLKRHIIGKF